MLSVLFDLDDTLILNNAELFTRVYLGLLGKHLQADIDPQKMVQALMEGTRQMVIKTTIAGTLEETFDQSFYPAIGLSKESLAFKINDFYQNVFPVLQKETSPRPGAVETVHQCISRGWTVAIATNPLFPMAAVLHRLKWAGLDSGSIPFATITSFDTYHFAKPQPAYFSEVAARIDGFNHPIVMVGNDLKEDIIPSSKAGMPSFWITDTAEPLPPEIPSYCAKGNMKDVFPWLEKIDSQWKQEPPTISSLLSVLRGGAAAIDAIVRSVPVEKWTRKINKTEWSLTEILCHLRDLDQEINLARIKTILQEHKPFIAGIESDRWAEERNYICQNGLEALGEFITARQDMIDILENAQADDWDRIIRHSIFGPTTLKEMVGFIVSHDNNHITQINKQIKTCSNV
jgi:FMN phosphatase YigB (HAD superfamily)